MSTKTEQRTYEDAVAWLRDHGFDILEAPGTKSRVFVKKLGCSAAIEKADDGGTKVFARPGYLIGGEISSLADNGNPKLQQSIKAEVQATAHPPKAPHPVAEQLRE